MKHSGEWEWGRSRLLASVLVVAIWSLVWFFDGMFGREPFVFFRLDFAFSKEEEEEWNSDATLFYYCC